MIINKPRLPIQCSGRFSFKTLTTLCGSALSARKWYLLLPQILKDSFFFPEVIFANLFFVLFLIEFAERRIRKLEGVPIGRFTSDNYINGSCSTSCQLQATQKGRQ